MLPDGGRFRVVRRQVQPDDPAVERQLALAGCLGVLVAVVPGDAGHAGGLGEAVLEGVVLDGEPLAGVVGAPRVRGHRGFGAVFLAVGFGRVVLAGGHGRGGKVPGEVVLRVGVRVRFFEVCHLLFVKIVCVSESFTNIYFVIGNLGFILGSFRSSERSALPPRISFEFCVIFHLFQRPTLSQRI